MPTIKDVARASGVSQATVSEVINNGRRPVHPRTRERVLAAVEELGYHPSAVARGLAKRRMNTLGLAFPHWEGTTYANAYLLAVLDGILSSSTRHGQSVMLLTFPEWPAAASRPEFSDGRCDGVLLLSPPIQCALMDTLRQRNVPFVAVNWKDPSGRTVCVDVDNAGAAAELTRHLLELGHRRFAFVRQPWDYEYPFCHERRQGIQRSLADAGLPGTALMELTPEKALEMDAEPSVQPTALICCYDGVALPLMERFARRGVRVPEDISVVGFDDIPAAAGSAPPLTTVRQPVAQLGQCGAEMLMAMVRDNAPPAQDYLPTELVIRESAAPPPGARADS